MADTYTTNFNYTLPEVGASTDTWGTKLNANWSALDTDLQTISDVADAALGTSGGSLTGAIDITAAVPYVRLIESGVTANNTTWDVYVNGEQFSLRAWNDAVSTSTSFLVAERTANTIDSVNIAATAVTINGSTAWHAGNDGSGSGLDADKLRNTTPSTFGLSLLDDADAATARTTLGLGTAATQASTAFEAADAAIVKSDEAETITANWDFTGQVTFDKVYTPPVADTISGGTLTIDTDDSNVFTVTVGSNITTLTLSNADQGQTINILFTIGGTGGYTATWPASFKWAGGSAGVLSTGVGDIDLLVATYIGTTWYVSLLNDFQ